MDLGKLRGAKMTLSINRRLTSFMTIALAIAVPVLLKVARLLGRCSLGTETFCLDRKSTAGNRRVAALAPYLATDLSTDPQSRAHPTPDRERSDRAVGCPSHYPRPTTQNIPLANSLCT